MGSEARGVPGSAGPRGGSRRPSGVPEARVAARSRRRPLGPAAGPLDDDAPAGAPPEEDAAAAARPREAAEDGGA